MTVLAALVALTCSAEPPPTHIGVTDFRAQPELASLGSALSGLVANELTRLGAFQVTSARQVADLMTLERQKQLLGCQNDTCVSESAIDLGFDFLVSGTLTQFAGTRGKLTLELMLLNPKEGKRIGSQVVEGTDPSELMTNVTPAAVKLVGALLKERSGTLVVTASEAGAVLKVDDVAAGTTPLPGKLQVAGGPHYLKLEKEGFVAWQKEVRVTPNQVTEEAVRLVPSADFVSAYESKQRKLRFGFWATAALAVAGVGTGVAFEARAASQYAGQPGSFVSLRERVAKGDESARAAMNQARADVATGQTLSAVFTGVGAVAAAGAVVLWVVADDPDRYGAYREVGLTGGPARLGLRGTW